MILPGTTPKHVFNLPFVIPEGSAIRIIYKQKEDVLFVKKTADCNVNKNTIITRLTQEETFLLDNDCKVLIQVRILTPEEDVLASRPIGKSVGACLEKEIMRSEEE